MMAYCVKNILLLTLTLCLTACIRFGSSEREGMQDYTLSNPEKILPQSTYTGKVVMVHAGTSFPGMRDTGIVYTQQDLQLKKYALHHWIAPPATIIAPIFAGQLESTGSFKAVVTAPTYAGKADYQIYLVLQKLQQDFLSAKKAKETLVLQLILIHMQTNQVLAAKVFQASTDAAPDASGSVVAANQALAQLMPSMIEFVVHTLH
jgi:ABC-type uncharacterized transport system auxiliary subunit